MKQELIKQVRTEMQNLTFSVDPLGLVACQFGSKVNTVHHQRNRSQVRDTLSASKI